MIKAAGLSASRHPYEKKFVKIEAFYSYTSFYQFPGAIRALIWPLAILPVKALRKALRIINLYVFKSYSRYYWSSFRISTLETLSKEKCDIIIANDIDTLPLAIALKRRWNCKVIFDAHEYSPLEYEHDPGWYKYFSPYYTYLCKKYIGQADFCTTVSSNIARKYEDLTSVKFHLVLNAPRYENLKPTVESSLKIRYVHHGGASPMRRIEQLILAFKSIPDQYELHLILVRQEELYYNHLLTLARGTSNIFFHEPVPTTEIAGFINQFDVSLAIIPPINYNYLYCLPNKFFESVQGRLMILSGPSPEMQMLIERYKLGRITHGFEVEDIRNAVVTITKDDVALYKRNVDKAAKELSSEHSMKLLVEKVKEVCAE